MGIDHKPVSTRICFEPTLQGSCNDVLYIGFYCRSFYTYIYLYNIKFGTWKEKSETTCTRNTMVKRDAIGLMYISTLGYAPCLVGIVDDGAIFGGTSVAVQEIIHLNKRFPTLKPKSFVPSSSYFHI